MFGTIVTIVAGAILVLSALAATFIVGMRTSRPSSRDRSSG